MAVALSRPPKRAVPAAGDHLVGPRTAATVSAPRAPAPEAPAPPTPAEARALSELTLALRARTRVLHLRTAEEERALGVLEQTARALDRRLYAWTQTRGMGSPRAARWDAALRDPLAALGHVAQSVEPALFALLDPHPLLADAAVVRKLKDTARALADPPARAVVLVGPDALPPALAHDATVLELPLPGPEETAAALDEFIARAGVPARLDAAARAELVRAARGLSLKQLAAALARVLVARGVVDESAPHALRRARRDAIAAEGLALTELEPDARGLDALGGLDALKRWLELRGLALGATRRGLPAPRGVLLVGPRGTGKSLCVRALAAAWGLPLLQLSRDVLLAQAEPARGVRESVARAARLAPCVLLLDEVDRLARAGAAGAVAIEALLAWLDAREAAGDDGVCVAATASDPGALPDALARRGRLDEVFFVDLPAPAERVEIARIQLERRGCAAGEVDLEAIAEASAGLAGAEIAQAVTDALLYAARDGRSLATRDVLRALREAAPHARDAREPLEAVRRWAQAHARPASPPVADAVARRVTV